jgi:hypothetical protein
MNASRSVPVRVLLTLIALAAGCGRKGGESSIPAASAPPPTAPSTAQMPYRPARPTPPGTRCPSRRRPWDRWIQGRTNRAFAPEAG